MDPEASRLLALVQDATAALLWEWIGPVPGVENPCPDEVDVEDYRERLLERLTSE